MLVLTRRKGERIIIRCGDKELVLSVTRIDTPDGYAPKVRLGFLAPRGDFDIIREEVEVRNQEALGNLSLDGIFTS